MKQVRSCFSRLLGLLRRGSRDAEMAEEIRQHLDRLTERKIAAGSDHHAIARGGERFRQVGEVAGNRFAKHLKPAEPQQAVNQENRRSELGNRHKQFYLA